MKYNHELLDPRPIETAKEANARVLGSNLLGVLGIEVTIPALAEQCNLGNIDPQHLGGIACRAAIECSVDQPLPIEGVTLATVRADNDSIGSMALLEIRAEGAEINEVILARIKQIADSDKEQSADWPGPKLISDPEHYVSEMSVLSAISQDFKMPLGDRVKILKEWLISGQFEGQEVIRQKLIQETAEALKSLTIRLTESGVAVVEGNHRLAMSLGYSLSPIVVASNPDFRFAGGELHLKHTVARYNTNVAMDWNGLKTELADTEPGWGGSSSIMGSPQGVTSKLTTNEVVGLVGRYQI